MGTVDDRGRGSRDRLLKGDLLCVVRCKAARRALGCCAITCLLGSIWGLKGGARVS